MIKHYQYIQKNFVKGASGKISLVLNTFDNHLYALKEINLFQQTKQTLDNELNLHALLDHPNILKQICHFRIKTKVYIVLEYCQNGNLYDFIRKNNQTISEKQCFKYFYQILKGVDYIHSKQMIHRDLKLENVLLDCNLDVKICDFGSLIYKQDVLNSQFIGTIDYMAPEILQIYHNKHNNQFYDHKVDIYALGVILYEMIEKKTIYKGITVPAKLKNIQTEIVKFEKASYTVRDLIRKMVNVNQQDRIGLADIWKHQWIVSNLAGQQHNKQCYIDYVLSSRCYANRKRVRTISQQTKRIFDHHNYTQNISKQGRLNYQVSNRQVQRHSNSFDGLSYLHFSKSNNNQIASYQNRNQAVHRSNLDNQCQTAIAQNLDKVQHKINQKYKCNVIDQKFNQQINISQNVYQQYLKNHQINQNVDDKKTDQLAKKEQTNSQSDFNEVISDYIIELNTQKEPIFKTVIEKDLKTEESPQFQEFIDTFKGQISKQELKKLLISQQKMIEWLQIEEQEEKRPKNWYEYLFFGCFLDKS